MESSFGRSELDEQRRALVEGDAGPDGREHGGGSKQLNDILHRDPLLRSIDQMWNANPFREIVPVDWAEIARALRTVWMLSLARPGESLQSAAELNRNCGSPPSIAGTRRGSAGWAFAQQGQQSGDGAKPKGGDKRFAAPEWHTNPVYAR